MSSEFSQAPLKVCGNRRVSLYCTTGSLGSSVPPFRVVLDTRTLAVAPKSL
ncbi:hypothetical protein D3C76_1220350 [compost metagenome]